MSKILIAYFSATGTTKNVAEKLAKTTNADIYEIEPEIPYTDDDLDWHNTKSRSSIEMQETPEFRPAISAAEKVKNIEQYEVLMIGFPIWWYVAPTIINTFLESYDLAGKKIVLFATSGMSGMGETIEHLKPSAPGAEFLAERRFDANVSQSDMEPYCDFNFSMAVPVSAEFFSVFLIAPPISSNLDVPESKTDLNPLLRLAPITALRVASPAMFSPLTI